MGTFRDWAGEEREAACGNLLEFVWNLLEFVGICRNFLGFVGICWNLLEF